jgi:hypothetical protein
MKYSTAQIVEMFNVTRSYLHQLRMGYMHSFKREGKKYSYKRKPKLIENKDWSFVRGNIVFKQSAINKLERIIKKP